MAAELRLAVTQICHANALLQAGGRIADSVEAKFGSGLIRAKFFLGDSPHRAHVSFQGTQTVLSDSSKPIWIEVRPPFKGSLCGVAIDQPFFQAKSALEKRGASVAGDTTTWFELVEPYKGSWYVFLIRNENHRDWPIEVVELLWHGVLGK